MTKVLFLSSLDSARSKALPQNTRQQRVRLAVAMAIGASALVASSLSASVNATQQPVQANSETSQQAKQRIAQGQVMFHYYSQDYFTALTQLALNSQRGLLDDHGQDQLVRAGLEFDYDMNTGSAQAFNAFEQNDPEALSDEHRDYVYYRFAQGFYKKGQFDDARRALNKVGDNLATDYLDGYYFLNAQLSLKEGRMLDAEAMKNNISADSIFHRYLAFNTAMAYLAQSQGLSNAANQARIIDSLQSVVDLTPVEVSDNDAEVLVDVNITDELEAIVDRAYVALGFVHLELNDNPAALAAFEQVSQRGMDSESAMLGYGWAKANNDDYDGAVLMWQQLATSSSQSVFAHEARLALGFAFEQMSDKEQAFAAYQLASRRFILQKNAVDSELASLTDNPKGYVLSLLAMPSEQSALGQRGEQISVSLPAVYDDVSAIAGNEFQQSVQDLNSLRAAMSALTDWKTQLSSVAQSQYQFSDANAKVLSQSEETALRAAQLNTLQSRYQQSETTMDALASRYAGKLFQRDPVVGKKPELQRAYADYQRLRNALDASADSAQKDQLQAQLNRIGGALLWQIGDYYLDEQGRLAKELLANDLSRFEQAKALSIHPISTAYARINAKLDAAKAIEGALVDALQTTLMASLKGQQQALTVYLEQAKVAQMRMTDEVFIRGQQMNESVTDVPNGEGE
ncbi:hypothetical protein QWY77_07865 [Thalassotalea ponticola]|uniref:tetratricopeptide repeat protein n=1 Tax=Thalassotalea ponticola TaxID=1523392 RepID=UPI0025B536AC|nr:hypothetical protein [Thalassotalea ponticola]MDN3652678.1 hypothetical protein [Thalassotalea ponticola]